ncbi:MAG: OFA family MFS transporter [Desulfovibrionales bacterium]|nr:OFA family MFS transporter [Desulfovibrionales bacterium]
MNMTSTNKGWRVTFAGLGINLALGVLYAWSIFKGEITSSIGAGGPFTWDPSAANDPYALCCLVFSFSMILAGKVQDRFGPRLTAMIGGVLVGSGMVWASLSTAYFSWLLGFGVLAGMGMGFGYAAATPPALKWFPASKTGLVAGIVVAGFGLAPVYIAPLATWLIAGWGLAGAMKFLGMAFIIVVGGLAILLVNPPAGYIPANPAASSATKAPLPGPSGSILIQGRFWVLWITYFIAAGAGLMVIGSVAEMAKKSMGEYAFVVVACMAVGNAGGRIVAGLISDRIGRKATLAIMLGCQALLMFLGMSLIGADVSALLLVLLATGIGFNYGTNLSLFPSFTKDLWGLRSFGTNYGLLFTAWGVGGFALSRISQMLQTSTGTFAASFLTAGILLLGGLVLTVFGLARKT